MDIIEGLNLHRNLAGMSDTASVASNSSLSELNEPQQENHLALEQANERTKDSEIIIENAHLDELVNDRQVFKFSFGDNGKIIAEIVDSETGDVIKQLHLEQNSTKPESPNPIGTLVHIRV